MGREQRKHTADNRTISNYIFMFTMVIYLVFLKSCLPISAAMTKCQPVGLRYQSDLCSFAVISASRAQ